MTVMMSTIFLIAAIILFVIRVLLSQVGLISSLLSIVIIASLCPLCGSKYNRIIPYTVFTKIILNI